MRLNLTAALVVLAMVAVACGSDGGAEDPTTTGATSAATTAATEPTTSPTGAPTTQGSTVPADADAIAAAREQLDSQVFIATEPWSTNWAKSTIDLGELLLGIGRIDPRDAIRPIDEPRFDDHDTAAGWLEPQEPGALVQVGGEARFYPLSILHRHEIVNDQFGDVPVAVTYCPLCNTAISFDRRVDGATLRFGVSGLLRNSDLVMWDDQSLSLWQQVTGESIVGDAAGTRLTPLSTAIVSFGDFTASFPDGMTLSPDTGFGIAYGANPYFGYSSQEAPYSFFQGDIDPRYPALERVVGVTVGDGAKAFPFSEIAPLGTVNDMVGGVPVAVFWGGNTSDALDTDRVATGQEIGTGVAYVRSVGDQTLTFAKEGDVWTDEETGSTWTLLGEAVSGPLAGERLEIAIHRNEFWFAWGAFFPDSEVFVGP